MNTRAKGGLPWGLDLDTITAAATALGAGLIAVARLLRRRVALDHRNIGLLLSEMQRASDAHRAMLIAYERTRSGRTLATIEAERVKAEATSIARYWTRRPVGKDYDREVLDPLRETDERFIATDDLTEDSTLRAIYERDSIKRSKLLVVERSKDGDVVRLVSLNRTSDEPVDTATLASIRDLAAKMREALGETHA